MEDMTIGEQLLTQLIADLGLEGLSTGVQQALAARFTQMSDAGFFSNNQLAAVLLGTAATKTALEAKGVTTIVEVGTAVGTAKENIDLPDTPTEITFSLEATADSINEGEANTFTVKASAPVTEDTVVTFQLSVDQAGDTASLADFNAGAFNEVQVTILAGQTEATFDVESISADGTEVSEKYTVLATVNGETLSKQVTILDGAIGAGQTFQLTKDLDIIPGMTGSNGNTVTSGNDLIIGITDSATNSTNSTLNSTDLIDAGEGTDTLKVVAVGDNGTTVPTNFENVEVVEVQSSETGTLTVNTTTATGVEQLNLTKAAGVVNAKADATTDVDASMKAAGKALTIDGGNNVNVALTDVADANSTVTVGGVAAAAGDVTVSMTGKAYEAAGSPTLSAVSVTGGKTVTVNQTATGDASAAATDDAAGKITQGAVTVTADTSTTEVTVTQDASRGSVDAVTAAAGTMTTQEITFAAVTAGTAVTLNFTAGDSLTFTAKKDLTAAEVASAFANLDDGDIQVEGAASLGLYTSTGNGADANAGKWSSGEVVAVDASTAKVTFSNAVNTVTAITATGATAGTKTAGINAATALEGVAGIVNGKVTVDEDGAGNDNITTITVDGYGDASAVGTATALTTLNLSNSGLTITDSNTTTRDNGTAGDVSAAASMTVADTAATLDLNLEAVGHKDADAALTFTAAPTTLNVTSTGDNYVALTDTANAIEALNVDGNGVLDLDASVVGTALKTVTVTGEAGLKLEGSESASLTSVDTTGTTGKVTSTINGTAATYAGGAGVDMLTLATGTALDKSIDLGAGDDTLVFGAAVTGSSTTLSGGDGVDSLSMAVANAANLDGSAQSFYTNFERLVLNDAAGSDDGSEQTVAINLENLGFTNYVTTNGTLLDTATAANSDILELQNLASNGTVVLAAAAAGANTKQTVSIKDAGTNAADVLNLITNAATATNLGTLTADEVETINITANDTDLTETNGVPNVSTNTLTLDADKAGAITVAGAGNLDLTLAAATTEVTSVDASAMTGALTLATLVGDTAATTVTGGAGKDVLTANGANDVLIGGAGDDTLKVAGSVASAVTLTGGEGIDSFDVSAFLAANGGAAVTITDFSAGETIKFATSATANFATAKVQLIEEATFSEYVQEAAAQADAAAEVVEGTAANAVHGIAWFEFNNNTFIVQDVDGDGAFTDGADIIVKLTGIVDLGNDSFSVTNGTLEFIA